ncbi:hypothetical protein BDA96_01G243900 [Sorghum bicolor]|nr:hypothetical protein BDA96_01G243900 [Sorghum bicolor]
MILDGATISWRSSRSWAHRGNGLGELAPAAIWQVERRGPVAASASSSSCGGPALLHSDETTDLHGGEVGSVRATRQANASAAASEGAVE